MSNAVKFTSVGEVFARVTREAAGGPAEIRFEVMDSGIGIERRLGRPDLRLLLPSGRLDHAPVRRHRPRTDDLKATGRADGREDRRRERRGQGQHLLVHGALEAVDADETAATGRPAFEAARVLAVDDNASSRSMLERQLRSWGLDCDTAAYGDVALEMIRVADDAGLPYGMVLVDAGMPGMSGIELTRGDPLEIRGARGADRHDDLVARRARGGNQGWDRRLCHQAGPS